MILCLIYATTPRLFSSITKASYDLLEYVDDEMDLSALGFSDDIKNLLEAARNIPADTAEKSIRTDSDSSDDTLVDSDDSDEIGESYEDQLKYVQEITGIFSEMDMDQDFVTSPDDIRGEDGEDQVEAEAVPAVTGDDWKEKVQKIIREVIKKQGLYVQKIYWGGNRVEVVISASDDPSNPIGPSVSALQLCHRSMYDEFELREEELAVVTKFEIVVASPGIGEILRTDQDFVSFKGFMVAVSTTEIYKKKTIFEGTLVQRTADDVCISLKGRIIKVPRVLVNEVRLPKPKYEITDTEMRKLR